jgi:hypothetical protein
MNLQESIVFCNQNLGCDNTRLHFFPDKVDPRFLEKGFSRTTQNKILTIITDRHCLIFSGKNLDILATNKLLNIEK